MTRPEFPIADRKSKIENSTIPRNKTMKHIPSKLSLIAAVLAISVTIPAANAASATRGERLELSATPGGALTFKTVGGAIEIKTHDRDVVILESELKTRAWTSGGARERLEAVEVVGKSTNGDVDITVRWKGGKAPSRANLSGKHVLVIPKNYHVDLQTAGGGINAKDTMNGNVVAKTSGGPIEFQKVIGTVNARTSGGSIEFDEVVGNLDVGTSGGSITLGSVDGDVSAKTSGGGIKVGPVSGRLHGRTSGGSIRAEWIDQIEQPVELKTSGGSIRVQVPANFKADLDAHTSGGGVKSELAVDGTVRRNSIVGKLNGGGPKVVLETSGGGIRIEKR